MCLKVTSELLVAEEDILCYKIVIREPRFKKEFNGKEFAGQINCADVKGHISIEDGSIYFCTDILDGASCKEKFGHKYSWALDRECKKIFVEEIQIIKNGELLPESYEFLFLTPYRDFPVIAGETYTSHLGIHLGNVFEGLHSFAKKEDCEKMSWFNNRGYLATCIIPRGSHYYEGLNDGCKNYASDQLFYKEIIEKIS